MPSIHQSVRPTVFIACAALLLASCGPRTGTQSAAGRKNKNQMAAAVAIDASSAAFARDAQTDGPTAYYPLAGEAGAPAGAFAAEDHLELPVVPRMDRGFTVEVWVNGGAGTVWSWAGEGDADRLSLELTDEGLAVRVRGGEATQTGVTAEDRWQDVALGWRAFDGVLTLSVDGEERWRTDVPDGFGAAGHLVLGQRQMCAGGCFEAGLVGALNEVVVYPHRLDSSRLLSHIEVAAGKLPPTPSSAEQPVAFVPQTGHGSSVSRAVFSPDGRLAATLGGEGRLFVWDLQTGVLVKAWPRGGVTSMAFSRDGRRLITTNDRFSLTAVDVVTGLDTDWLLRPTDDAATEYHGVQVSADGRYALAGPGAKGGFGGQVQILDTENGEIVSDESESAHALLGDIAWSPTTGLIAQILSAYLTVYDIHQLDRVHSFNGAPKPDGVGDKIAWRKQSRSGYFHGVAMSPDGGVVAASYCADRRVCKQARIDLHDGQTGEVLRTLTAGAGKIRALEFVSDGQLVSADASGTISTWQVADGALLATLKFADLPIGALAFDPTGQRVLIGYDNGNVDLIDTQTFTVVQRLRNRVTRVRIPVVSRDRRRLVTHAGNDLYIWDLDRLSLHRKLPLPEGFATTECRECDPMKWKAQIPNVAIAHDGTALVLQRAADSVTIDIDSGRITKHFPSALGQPVAFVPGNASQLVFVDYKGGKIQFVDANTGKTEVTHRAALTGEPLVMSEDGERYKVGVKRGNYWEKGLYETSTGKLLDHTTTRSPNPQKWEKGLPDGFKTAADHANKSFWYSSSPFGVYHTLPDDRTGNFVVSQDGEWIYYNSDGLFTASPGGARLLAGVKGLRGYGFEQLALSHNRPDELIAQYGGGEEDLVALYGALHDRRVSRAEARGATAGDAIGSAIIRDTSRVSAVGLVEVYAELADPAGLAGYRMYVNDVPLDAEMAPVDGGTKQTIDRMVQLTPGTNKIEIAAVNTKGQESLRALRVVSWSGKEDGGDLYVIGFGVSKYGNEALNLKYAHKDVLDLTAALGKVSNFDNVHVHTFVDDQVTPASVASIAELMADAQPRDALVLFIAGHGMYHDGHYYYLTHGTDLANVAGTSASLELFEGALLDIAPRRKLFLMDTCESGEVDTPAAGTGGGAAAGGLAARAIRGLSVVEKPSAGAHMAPQAKDRFIYADTLRRTGAIVLSSSRGNEYSYESDAIQNGFFTHAIVNALTTGAGDSNGDKSIDTDELRLYVAQAVAQATSGRQNPTVDRDNLFVKLRFSTLP